MPEKILIIHLGALGDLLLSRPALLAIRKRFLQAEIDFLGHPHLVSLIQPEMEIKHIYNVEGSLFFTLYTGANEEFWRNYNLIIFFARKRQPEWERILALVPSLFIETTPPPRENLPVFQFQMQQLSKFGFKDIPISEIPALRLPPQAISLKSRPEFLIHPGSGSPSKNWSPKYFAEVFKAFSQLRPGLIIGPADREVAEEVLFFLENEQPRLLKKMILLKQLPLLALATVIAQARFFLGNDSGISHLAAALGIPSFVIFGPTASSLWHPWGPKVKVFTPKVPCAPCDDEERRSCQNRVCLESIKPEEVINAIKTEISKGI